MRALNATDNCQLSITNCQLPEGCRSPRRRGAASTFALCIWQLAISSSLAGAQTAAPDLRIETFAAARAYCVGTEPVTVVGTVRNAGMSALAAGTATARIYALAGLDYTEGDTAPKLPAIGPGASTTLKWKLQPTGADSPLIASLAVIVPGGPPLARVIAIPRLAEAPPPESAAVLKEATARIGRGAAALENSKVRVRVVGTEADVPVILLSAHTPGGWRQVGVSSPPAEVESGEGGQRPWWEAFKVSESQAVNAKGEASLVLSGAIGFRWRATLRLTLRTGSAVVDAVLLLAPSRQVHLSGIRFCPFLAGEGSFSSAASETMDVRPSGPNTVAAVRWGDITCGVLCSGEAPAREWEAVAMPNVEGADYRLLAQEWRGPPVDAAPGALIALKARLFALTPSPTVQDAMRISLPPALRPPGP